ncbi:MAG: DUF423 domain-containing protein [Bacteroidia bacterium]|jgi:uncharacterized membrane protein YgdD (TMEM256/DUF423 family)|nr:DUF423 domain-containing protein [Bacteroidia bacterium]
MNSRNPYTHMRAGAILCTVYVILGAFGAHGLESKLTVAQLATYHTGLRYLIVHAIALILTNHTYNQWKTEKKYSNLFFYLGILLFSFGLIVHATKELTGIGLDVFAHLAPIGGLSFITGWFFYMSKIGKQ